MALIWLKLSVVGLYAVMILRTLRSGTLPDRLLGASILLGVVALFALPVWYATGWLIACSAAYLISQIVTSARLLSRALPVLGAFLTAALCWFSDPARL